MKYLKLTLFIFGSFQLCACSVYDNYCNKIEQCAADNEDGFSKLDVEDDYHNVCVAQLSGQEKILRSNDEEECQDVANLYSDYISCLSSLSCSELKTQQELLTSGACDTAYTAYADSASDNDDKCQTSVTGNCDQSSHSLNMTWLFLALMFIIRPSYWKSS